MQQLHLKRMGLFSEITVYLHNVDCNTKDLYTTKSRLPLYSRQIICPQLILQYISNLREADTSHLRTMDADKPLITLADTKLPLKMDILKYAHMHGGTHGLVLAWACDDFCLTLFPGNVSFSTHAK